MSNYFRSNAAHVFDRMFNISYNPPNMTIEARKNYFGIFTGKSKRVEPDPEKSIKLEKRWLSFGNSKSSYIIIADKNTIVLREIHKAIGRKRDSFTMPPQTLNGDAINKAKLKTGRNFLGISTSFTHKP